MFLGFFKYLLFMQGAFCSSYWKASEQEKQRSRKSKDAEKDKKIILRWVPTAKFQLLENKFDRHDNEIQALFEAIRQLMETPNPPRKKIGYKNYDAQN